MNVLRALRARFRAEEGFTLVEVLVAAFILVLGALGVFLTFTAAIHNVQRGRDMQVALSIAQKEVEKIRALPYGQIVMAATPTPESPAEEGSPFTRIVGSEFQLDRSGSEPAPLAYAEGGVSCASVQCVNSTPGSTCVGTNAAKFTNGTAVGRVYCYVTKVADPACTATSKSCINKRIVVAVWLDKGANPSRRPYYELQSTVNPTS